jgi:catechol 2,3-dioxygenase-like lactoylglutathione lyase family enzyme
MTYRRCLMAITLNHTIVPAHDKEAAAQFFADIFGLRCAEPMGHFAPVRVNDTLTLDFDTRERFESHHYAFHVSDAELTRSSIGSRAPASRMEAGLVPLRMGRSTPAVEGEASTSGTRTAISWSS